MPCRTNRRTRLQRTAGFLILALLLLGLLPLGAAAAPLAAPSGVPASAELPLGCYETIANGGFEQLNVAWVIPPSLYPGVYDNTLAFEGNFSMLLGRVDGPIYAADSTVEQTIDLPGDANSIILNFRYYGRIDGTAGTPDRQYLDIVDATTGSFIRRQFEARNGDRLWLGAQYSLTDLRGRTIILRFGVNNDGAAGRIAMNIDQVSLYYCKPQSTATPTPTPTVTPTFWPTAIPTNFPTPWPTPWPTAFPTVFPTAFPTGMPPVSPVPPIGTCTNIVLNGGFEGSGGWEFGKSPIPGQIVSAPVQEGVRAAQLGNPPGYCPDSLSFSSVRQLVTIPPDAASAQLSWFALYGTQETPSNSIAPGADRQELILLNPDLSTLAVINRQRSNSGGYVQQVVDLSGYRGRSFYIYFNALNDGNNVPTWMYLDNVMLCVSASGMPPQPQPFGAGGSAPAQPYVAASSPQAQPYATTQPFATAQPYVTAQPQGYASPMPTYFVPTITATPTSYPNPAPLDASAPPEPGATPNAAPVGEAQTQQQFAGEPSGQAPESNVQLVSATQADETTTTGRTFNALAGMCGVVIVALLLFGGILYVISRPKRPPPGGPPQQSA